MGKDKILIFEVAKQNQLPNILMFGWEFPPFNSGGLGVACEGLTIALSASGVPLTFVLPVKIPVFVPWCKFAFADESEVMTETQIKNMYAAYNSHTISEEEKKLGLPGFVSSSLIERVRRYAKQAPAVARENYHSVIHAHDWLTYPAGVAAKKTSGKPLIVHVHATQFDQSAGDNVNREVYEIEKAGMWAADMVVAVSNRTRNKVIEKYGIHPDKVKVVHNGVEFQKSNDEIPAVCSRIKNNGGKIVLFSGRITLQKGPDYFVQMAKRVLEHEPKTFFMVSGSGDMEGQMVRQVAQMGLSPNFIFCGWLQGKELAAIYRYVDMYVMPSVSEPFGILPLECMISDTPVLISKESGVSEVVNCVLKSHFWDIDDMADKVISVLRHQKLKGHLSANGREEVKNIHWHKAAKALIDLYGRLVPEFRCAFSPVYISA